MSIFYTNENELSTLICDVVDAEKIIVSGTTYKTEITTETLTSNHTITIPNKSGTILLTRARNYYCTIYGSGTNSGLIQNQFVKMNVTTQQANNRGSLTQTANNRITYSGTTSHVDFLVQFYASIKSTGNNVSCAIKLYLNGYTNLNYSIVTNTMTTSADVEYFNISTEVDMTTGDYIECWIANTSGVQNMIINNYSLTVSSLEIFND